MTILELSSDLVDLKEEVTFCHDSEDAEELMSSYLIECVDGAKDHKRLDNYVALISEFERQAEARKKEAERLNTLAKIDESLSKRLRTALKNHLENIGLRKISTERYNINIVKSGGLKPLILDPDLDPDDLPEPYKVTLINPDKVAIRAALEAGESLPFASLGERSETLRIQ
ncbi:siphovirus Gp157 family protein [Synechococcus sp. PCC 6312]|uniref:siphovirus Gp157 family protein n=1 Tax=Synechococcus sp. (strain ATCC 27167 / PCC 6312) TaxID=195253 RepID=UPI00029F1418|nr:siphovirus Gp157 family protein [Synechococcus sp. PCC 6312]AFY61850.1 hypothetical protein Syn6312_2770 [Synechococcus sp. PCC 6312]